MKGVIRLTQISVSDLKVNAGKYVSMAQEQDILITKNGKVVAKLVTARPDKKASWGNIVSIFQASGLDMNEEEIGRAREERILRT